MRSLSVLLVCFLFVFCQLNNGECRPSVDQHTDGTIGVARSAKKSKLLPSNKKRGWPVLHRSSPPQNPVQPKPHPPPKPTPEATPSKGSRWDSRLQTEMPGKYPSDRIQPNSPNDKTSNVDMVNTAFQSLVPVVHQVQEGVKQRGCSGSQNCVVNDEGNALRNETNDNGNDFRRFNYNYANRLHFSTLSIIFIALITFLINS